MWPPHVPKIHSIRKHCHAMCSNYAIHPRLNSQHDWSGRLYDHLTSMKNIQFGNE